MSDSNIPNSKATPAWKELPYTRTTFEDALKLSPVDGVQGLYKGFAPIDWCMLHEQGPCLQGGYICSIFIAGSKTYFRSRHGNHKQPDPISMHVQFLELIPRGPFHVAFTTLRLGSRHSIIEGKFMPADLTHNPKTYTIAICTMGDLNSNKPNPGISRELPPITLPNREKDCARLTNSFIFFVAPPTSSCRFYTPKDGPTLLWSPSLGQNRRDQWQKLDNGGNFRLEHIGLLSDLVPVLPLNYEKGGLDACLKYEFPSLSITFDFVQDPADQMEWILSRAVMNRLQDGRFDMDVLMVDDQGKLVASIKHQSLMFSTKGARPASLL